MSWNDSNSDDMPIEARSERCTPEKYWTAPRGPVPMDDLLEYINSPIMGHLRRFYDHVFLFSIFGGNQDKENYTYGLIWQNPITDNPAQSKGDLLAAIYYNSCDTIRIAGDWYIDSNTLKRETK